MSFIKTGVVLLILLATTVAWGDGATKPDDDWIKGRLFAPEIVLRYQTQINLTEPQRKVIRGELAAVQSKVTTADFDFMEAAAGVQDAIDQWPVNKVAVLERVDKVLAADVAKKRAWLEMLINIKNALTKEQIAYLKKATGAAQ